MIDTETLTETFEKKLVDFQSQHQIDNRQMADMLLSFGVDTYIKDLANRSLNGDKAPYLADFHLRQGIKYYHQDLIRG